MTAATPDLPAVPGSMPFVRNVDTAPAYWWLNILWVVLVDGADTGGRYSLMHETLPKGSGAPPHKHTWSDEYFYMLDGKCTFLVGEEIRRPARAISCSCPATRATLSASTATPRFSSTATRPPGWSSPSSRTRRRPPSASSRRPAQRPCPSSPPSSTGAMAWNASGRNPLASNAD